MKAVLCRQYGPPGTLVFEEVPDPQPGPGQVLIDVRAAGVNFPDTLIIENKYQLKPALPFSPGAEVAGTVAAVGEGVQGLRPGDRVVAIPGYGGYAEKVLAPQADVFPLPEGIGFEDAAAFLIAYGTTHYALQERAAIRPGETLLVLGAAGGTGLSAVELGKLLGARVIAAASSDEKLALCREHGADEVINYSHEDLRQRLKELTGGRGVDVIYDPVGGPYSEPALRSMAWNGRFLVIGFTAGEIPKIALNLTLLKGCAIVGVWWGGFLRAEPQRAAALTRELVEWFRCGKVRPYVSKRYPLAQAAQALEDVAQRRVTGKMVLVP
ncbi:NADPH:quinone oxidoreductase family protein [Caldimonas thermodepolymerans]|jgi:NADPH:quinone reductase and related Zn-dependent oxidoreductases|uniref:NADPH2:quinone reductase n=1 Tax=Caldimonas thermodepolymerans TaxID=215580 RepID=A0AA46DEE6_9BURK|nr:NADPH:quinone oxidoreductase family protein [Caldimonas thermodepolymerans]TCP08192.1 NADPH2:quinone reductase [Caldimonas thermodepolymerans]UZG44949.1 NADPH:quinone oxidoreductase family protein [Caldimonas thermodepolymerans]UZG48691.1 NADPH:quinone oxidoreductase family protein [Caldimonas thermodepolymerans]